MCSTTSASHLGGCGTKLVNFTIKDYIRYCNNVV